MKTYIGNDTLVELKTYEESHYYQIQEYAAAADKEGRDEPFIIGDMGDVILKYKNWIEVLPRVRPFYAVKCNDDYPVLKVLADMGSSFDCASKGEIQKVLALGVTTDRIIYANPCKQSSMIKYAAKNNVSMMTFDNECELHKISNLYPEAQLVLRILPPSNFKVQCELGIKFGCRPAKAIQLLKIAKELNLNVMGVSFHVGSGCEEAQAFAVAIQQAREVFDQGLNLGFNMTLLDIGGGFPGHAHSPITFMEIASVVNFALDTYFPEEEGVDIIAEPGRYMVASAYTLGVNVIARRVVARDQKGENGELLDFPNACDHPSYMYYVNDGVYGSFNCVLYDHAKVKVNTLKNEEDFLFESSLWGPTCDGLDCILENVQLPRHEVGDWLYFKDMGAYTIAAASTFNGMAGPQRFYRCLDTIWHEVYPEKEPVCDTIKTIPMMKTGHFVADMGASLLCTSPDASVLAGINFQELVLN